MTSPYQPPESEVEAPIVNLALATRGKRLGGSIIDTLVSVPITYAVMYALGLFDTLVSGTMSYTEYALFLGVSFLVFFALNGFLLANRGQTVGKFLLKTQIVDLTSGRILPLGRLLGLRYVPVWIIGALPFVGNIASLVNVLFIFGLDRRCVHDLLAGTKVVQLDS